MNNIAVLSITSEKWTDIIRDHPGSNIFHTTEWAAAIKRAYGIGTFVAAILNQGSIACAAPFSISHNPLSGPKIISLPYTDFCAPLLIDGEEEKIESLTRLFEQIARSLNIGRIELRWEYTGSAQFVRRIDFLRHYLTLTREPEDVYRIFHRTQKQNIRVAIKNGVNVFRSTDMLSVREFYHLHCLTRKRLGLPVQPWNFFRALHNELLLKDKGFIMLAKKDGISLAGGLFLLGGKTITYKYAASNNFGQELRPNHLIIWTAVQWACTHGFTMLDFGRCDLDNIGLRAFKCRWGAKEVPLEYTYWGKIPKPPVSGRIDSLAKAVLRRSPLALSRLAGELLYPYIG